MALNNLFELLCRKIQPINEPLSVFAISLKTNQSRIHDLINSSCDQQMLKYFSFLKKEYMYFIIIR